MKTLLQYINEAKTENLDELIKHCQVNPNEKIFILTKRPDDKKIIKFSVENKKELEDFWKAMNDDKKLYGRYLSLQSSDESCSSAFQNLTSKVKSFKGYKMIEVEDWKDKNSLTGK